MKAAALNEFSDIGFLFIDLKENYSELDKELRKDYDWLVKAVKRICGSAKRLNRKLKTCFRSSLKSGLRRCIE